MKKVLYGFLLTLPLFAADESFIWPQNGVPVRQGVHIEWQRTGDANADGTMIFAWSDTRTGDRDVYAQKVNTSGETLWGATGVKLSDAMGRQEDPVLVTDGYGGAFVAWTDYRDDEGGDIYVQHVDAAGAVTWAAGGVPVAVNSGTQQLPNMARGADGYAYVIWYDTHLSQETDIFGTVMNLAGPKDDVNKAGFPVIAAAGAQTNNSIETSGGEAVVVWRDTRSPDNANLYTQRLDTTFARIWGATGKPVCVAFGDEKAPKVVPADGNRVILAWTDGRSNEQGDIYTQLLNENGDPVWTPDGIPVTNSTAKQENVRLKTDRSGIAYYIWEDYRNEFQNADVFIQSLDFNGNPRWQANGIPVAEESLQQIYPRLTNDDSDGVFVVWQDERAGGFPKSDIYLQHVHSDGSMEFPESGTPVTNGQTYQLSPLVRADGENGAFVVWGGQETGSIGIKGQHISATGATEWDADGMQFFYGIDGDASEAKVLPWGNHQFLVMWEDHRRGSLGSTAMAQVMDETAGIQYALNGEGLSENNEQNDPRIAPDGAGGAYLGFQSNIEGNNFLFAQHVNSSLQPTWGDTGFPVYDQRYLEQKNPLLVTGNDGNLYYIWSEIVLTNYTYNVFVQKFDPNGAALWQPGGIEIAPDEPGDNYPRAATALADSGLVIVWEAGPSFEDLNLYATKVTSAGTVAWRQTVVDAPRNQENVELVYDHVLDRYYIAWEDPRNMNVDLYMRYGDTEGNLSDDIIITAAPNDQIGLSLSIADDGSGSVWAAWQDFRDSLQYDIWAKNVSAGTDPIQITALNTNEIIPYIRAVTSDRFLIAWEDYRNGITQDLYFYDNQGQAEYVVPNGTVLCDAMAQQTAIQIVPYADNSPDSMKYALVWEDKRASGKTELFNIYAQTYSNHGLGVKNEVHPGSFALQPAYPNPFNGAVTITFTQPYSGNATLKVYDLLGRQVYKRTQSMRSRTSFHWNGQDNLGRNLRSGIYFVKVSAGNETFKQKITYLK